MSPIGIAFRHMLVRLPTQRALEGEHSHGRHPILESINTSAGTIRAPKESSGPHDLRPVHRRAFDYLARPLICADRLLHVPDVQDAGGAITLPLPDKQARSQQGRHQQQNQGGFDAPVPANGYRLFLSRHDEVWPSGDGASNHLSSRFPATGNESTRPPSCGCRGREKPDSKQTTRSGWCRRFIHWTSTLRRSLFSC